MLFFYIILFVVVLMAVAVLLYFLLRPAPAKSDFVPEKEDVSDVVEGFEYTLESFKNQHKNQDIYVIGSGKSLDFIDETFFEDKITIGVNQLYKKIRCPYYIRKEFKNLKETLSQLQEGQILFLSEGDCGNSNGKNKNYVEENFEGDGRIILFKHDNNILNLVKLPNDDKIVVSFSTITSGIHLAAYMGAKNILLVAHDCGTLDNESNFEGYHKENNFGIHKSQNAYNNWLSEIEVQTVTLKKLLKEKYGCNVYSINPFVNFGLEGHQYKSNVKQKKIEG